MSHLRTASSRRRGIHASTISSSRLRMDTHGGPRGNSRGRSPRHKEIDRVMKKARSESGPQSSYWTKKLLEVEEKDPNRWRHSGFKELYRSELGGSNGDSRSKSRSRSRNRSKKGAFSPPVPSRLPRTRSRSRDRSRSARDRSRSNHNRGRTARDRSRSPRGRSRTPRGRSRTPRDRSPRDRSRSDRDRSRSPRVRSRSPRVRSRSPRVRSRDRRDPSRSRGRPSTPASRPGRHGPGAPRSPPPERRTTANNRGSNRRRGRSSSKTRAPPSPPSPARSSSSSSNASSVESCSNESCSVCSPRRGSEAPARHHHSSPVHRSRSRSFSVPRSAAERVRSPPRPPEPAPPKRKKVAASSASRRAVVPSGGVIPNKAVRAMKVEGKRARAVAVRAPEGNGALHEVSRSVHESSRAEAARVQESSRGHEDEPPMEVGDRRGEGRRRRARSPGSSRRSGARDPVSVSSESESDSESVSQSSEDDTPPRLTLSERFGRMAQWSVDRREFDSVRMRITKDSHSSGKKVVIEDGASLSPPPSSIDGYMRGSYNSDGYNRSGTAFGQSVGALHRSPVPEYGHSSYRLGRGDESPSGTQTGGGAGVSAVIPEGTIGDWDDVHVRYRYYRDRGYFWDMGLEEYAKWEEWWAKYQEWLEMERYYEQVAQHREWAAAAAAAAAASGRPRHGGGSYGRRNRGRSNDDRGSGDAVGDARRGKGSGSGGGAWAGEAGSGGGRKRRR